MLDKLRLREARVACQRQAFGVTKDGVAVERITLENSAGTRAALLTRGATLAAMEVRDRDGVQGDVALGFETLAGYEACTGYVGCVVGRVANRIAGARFEWRGRRVLLSANEGANHLHGGARGLDCRVYEVADVGGDPARVVLRTSSPAGDQGYPGRLDVHVSYTLDDSDALRIDLLARTDEPTPVNLTHHGYWNLGTPAAGNVLGHVLVTPATHHLPTDAALIPTGEVAPVEGSRLDFREGATLQPGIDTHLVLPGGSSPQPRFAAELFDPASGRVLALHTTQQGFQLYTGDHLDGSPGKAGVPLDSNRGICLEPQHPPDAVNHPNFPSVMLSPGETYHHTIELRFSTR